MTNNSIKTDLGFLGEDYQKQLVKSLIEDQDYFAELYPVLDQNKFTNENLRRIVGYMKNRYEETEVVPTYTDIKVIILSKINDEITKDIMIAILKELYEMKPISRDIIEHECGNFFKQQNLIRTLKEVDDIVKVGDFGRYEEIVEIIQKALEVGQKKELGDKLFQNIENDFSEDYRITIPTGADKLDDALYGGLAKGQLGVIIAPMGTGKTSATTGFAANAALHKCKENNYKGWKVLHVFFEDEDVDIRRKYYGFLTDIDAMNLSLPGVRETALKRIEEEKEKKEMMFENIRYKHMESLETSASDIENLIKREIASGFKVDLLIVDYFECLAAEKVRSVSRNKNEWTDEGITIRKLEKMAHKYNIGIWVPIQGNRESIGIEKVGLAQGGGSIKKTQAAHIVLTFAQTDDQKLEGRMNMFLAKLRSGKINRNQFFNIEFNNGTCKFDMSNIDSDTTAIDKNSKFESEKELSVKQTNAEYKS